MTKKSGLLLVALSLATFLYGCGGGGGSVDVSNIFSSKTVEVNGSLATTSAPSLGANRAIAAAELTGQIENESGTAYTSNTVTITGTNYKANCVAGVSSYRAFVVFKHTTSGKILLKKYLGVIPSSIAIMPTTKVTVTNANVDAASTAQALVAQALLTSTSTPAATTSALNSYLVPTGTAAETYNATTYALPIESALQNYVDNTATYTAVAQMTTVLVNIIKSANISAANAITVVPSASSVGAMTAIVASVNTNSAFFTAGTAEIAVPATITLGTTTIKNTDTSAPAVTDAAIASTVNAEATAAANNGLKVSTVTAGTATIYPVPSSVPTISPTSTFSVNFTTVGSSTAPSVFLGEGFNMSVKVEATSSNGTMTTRFYNYPATTSTSTVFSFTDDFTAPTVTNNVLNFAFKSSPVHNIDSGTTYKVTILTVNGIYNLVSEKPYELIYDTANPISGTVKI